VKVGLNLMFLVDEAGGAGRYAAELVPALLEAEPGLRLTVFVNRDAPESVTKAEWAGEVEWVQMPTHFSNRTHLVGQAAALPVSAARRRLDVVHSLANGGPPLTVGTRRVVTLLDLIWLHQREAWGTPAAVKTMAVLTRISARTANRVLTISKAARADIVLNFGVEPRKIDVTPLGVRIPPTVTRTEPDVPTILCVAQKRPYKNLASLIHALTALPDQRTVLVLPGAPTDHEEELRSLAELIGVLDRVRFPAWVADEELEALYASATCFVLPSLIEGFGLPVLEAMARGVPVACSNRPALPEVAGEAALFFDPTDQAAVTEAARRLLTDAELRERLSARGLLRASEFTWRRTAEETLASYRRAVGE
jgi:glycosyltransferase involved in cell wall biosynthesis